jgi:UDP-N-acetylmuramoyl-tripeptide--D-alanyl-D-alanine ligase
MKLIAGDVARITSGRIEPAASGDGSFQIETTDIFIDSRECKRGSLFIALKGEVLDGHDFLSDASRRGAVAAVVERSIADAPLPLVVVPTTHRALVDLAAWVRDAVDPLTVGITGSVGKTSTKDLLGSITTRIRPTVVAERSYNTETTVPLTLLRLTPRTEILICELGARGVGQIAELCEFVRPQVGVVTNVDITHMEMFGSVDAIATAKGELVEALPEGGAAILNIDDLRVAEMAQRTRAEVVSFGTSPDARVRGERVTLDERGRPNFRIVIESQGSWVSLSLTGKHQMMNALAAAAAAHAMAFSVEEIIQGLEKATVSPWRMEVTEAGGVLYVNDAYNAGPKSVAAALETTKEMVRPGARLIAVLGHMAELGELEGSEHSRVGAMAAAVASRLITVGDDASPIADGARAAGLSQVIEVAEGNEALAHLTDLQPGDVVLIKASRVVGLEGLAAQAVALSGHSSA